MAPLDFFDFERRASSFARVAAYYPPGFTLTGGEQAERVSGARASSGIFDVFGVQPTLGRGFLSAEDRAGAPAVAIISHELWMRRYQGDPSAVGQTILLSGRPYTLVGVLPEGFHSPAMWPRTPEVWVPLGLDPNVGRRDARMLRVLGRLRDGTTIEQARAELDVLATAVAVEHPDTNRATGATVAGLLEQLTRDARPSLYALTAAVLALLLVACANAAGLLIGDSLERRHEFATRLALGASRSRIVRTDRGGKLRHRPAGSGRGIRAGGLGQRLSRRGGRFVRYTASDGDSHRPTTFVAGVLLSLVCTTACALFAAYDTTRDARSGRRAKHARLDAAAHSRAGRTDWRRGGALVGPARRRRALDPQLLCAAVHKPRFRSLSRSDNEGVSAGSAISGGTGPRRMLRAGRRACRRTARGRRRLGRRLAAGQRIRRQRVLPSGRCTWRDRSALAELRVVGVDYFRTMGMPVIAGRPFDRRDVDGAPPVIAINAALARTYFGSENPIGRRVTIDRDGDGGRNHRRRRGRA